MLGIMVFLRCELITVREEQGRLPVLLLRLVHARTTLYEVQTNERQTDEDTETGKDGERYEGGYGLQQEGHDGDSFVGWVLRATTPRVVCLNLVDA
jgi:hypothetical protein